MIRCSFQRLLVPIIFVCLFCFLIFGPQFKRGFICGDPTISYKYIGDSFPNWLITLTVFSPLIFVSSNESNWIKNWTKYISGLANRALQNQRNRWVRFEKKTLEISVIMDQDFFCTEQLFLWTFGEFYRRYDFKESDWGTETSLLRYLSTRRHGKLYGWVMRDLFEERLQKLTETLI